MLCFPLLSSSVLKGPAQASFTTGELREILQLKNCVVRVSEKDLQLDPVSVEELRKDRGKRRMVDLLSSKAQPLEKAHQVSDGMKTLTIHFLQSPIEILADSSGNRVGAIKLEKNKLIGEEGNVRAVGTGTFSTIPCGIIFRSIGYKSFAMPGVPFDTLSGTVPNVKGRVTSERQTPLTCGQTSDQNVSHSEHNGVCRGLYVSGWLKRGPSGIIGTNKWCAEETADSILEDIKNGIITSPKVTRQGGVVDLLRSRGIHLVTFDDWKHIEQEEHLRGHSLGKAREKITSVKEMLDVLKSSKRTFSSVGNKLGDD